MCLVVPIFTGQKYQTDSLDGSSSAKDNAKISAPIGHWVVTILRYLALIALFAGIVTVITSVFLITPATANGRGSMPLVGDGPPST